MAYQDCLNEIRRAAGDDALSDDEIMSLVEELQTRARARAARDNSVSEEEALRITARELGASAITAARVEQRNAALNLAKRLEALDFVRTKFADDPALGLEALLVGVNRAEMGSRFSAGSRQAQLEGYYKGGLIADLERAGHMGLFRRGVLDRDVARALWQIGRAEPNFEGIPRMAREIAEIVHKWQEVARMDANRAGAWVGKIDGYITRQSHDVRKIRRASFEEWRDEILPKLDPRTFDGVKDVDRFLRDVYTGLASGVHLKAQSGVKATAFTGSQNIAQRLSHERVLHFKSADDWYDYNQRFGSGNLREAVVHGLDMAAQNTGLMRSLGTNPGDTLARLHREIAEDLKRSGDAAALRAFDNKRRMLENRLAELDGSVNVPDSEIVARASASARAVESMAKLGAAVLSAISDIPLYASELRYQGRGMLSGMAEAMGGLAQGMTNGRERRELAAMLGVFSETMSGTIGSRFSLRDGLPGWASRWQQYFFKLNGLGWWTDTLRASAAISMSHQLALNSNRKWSGLGKDLKRVLGLYGIDEGRWEAIRHAVHQAEDGRKYIVPEAIRDLDDAVLDGLIEGNATSAKRNALRDELEDQLRTYFADRAEFAVINPDARTRALMRQGTQPGTAGGEFLRMVGQFKAFPFAVIQKTLGREVYGRGSNTLAEALRNGNGEMLGLAQVMVWTTIFGYMAMSAKDLARGRTPRDPLDPKTWAAAMVQGGGLGIYGDFLFGDMKQRYGGGMLSTLAGPVLGSTEDFVDLLQRARDGDDLAAQTVNFVVHHTPFVNLFYTRMALDYLFLHQIRETLSPGSLKRMERRAEEQNAQTFLFPPSKTIPTGGGSRALEGVR